MATVSVQEDGGGDYLTLNAAFVASETDIEIEGEWDNPDIIEATCSTANTTVTAIGSSKHPGHDNDVGTPTHYRLHGDGTHCITVSADDLTLDGLDIRQVGSGASDECIRMADEGGTLTIQNCLIHSDRAANDQDGLYAGDINCTVNVINCFIYLRNNRSS